MKFRLAKPEDKLEWLKLRMQLWPGGSPQEHGKDIDAWLSNKRCTCVLASDEGKIVGFLEASVREDPDDCEFRSIGLIEGWFVLPSFRRKGVGRALVEASADWFRSKGLKEMLSDAELGDVASLKAHAALGFREVERAVRFRKKL